MARLYSALLLSGESTPGVNVTGVVTDGFVAVVRNVQARVSSGNTGGASAALVSDYGTIVAWSFPDQTLRTFQWEGHAVLPGPVSLSAFSNGGADLLVDWLVSGYLLTTP